MAWVIVVLLLISAVCTAFGIWWTARPVARHDPEREGVFILTTHDTWWERVRGVGALGVGLLLNTAASLVGVVSALQSGT